MRYCPSKMVTPYQDSFTPVTYIWEDKGDNIAYSTYVYLRVLYNKSSNTNTNKDTVFNIQIISRKTGFVKQVFLSSARLSKRLPHTVGNYKLLL